MKFSYKLSPSESDSKPSSSSFIDYMKIHSSPQSYFPPSIHAKLFRHFSIYYYNYIMCLMVEKSQHKVPILIDWESLSLSAEVVGFFPNLSRSYFTNLSMFTKIICNTLLQMGTNGNFECFYEEKMKKMKEFKKMLEENSENCKESPFHQYENEMAKFEVSGSKGNAEFDIKAMREKCKVLNVNGILIRFYPSSLSLNQLINAHSLNEDNIVCFPSYSPIIYYYDILQSSPLFHIYVPIHFFDSTLYGCWESNFIKLSDPPRSKQFSTSCVYLQYSLFHDGHPHKSSKSGFYHSPLCVDPILRFKFYEILQGGTLPSPSPSRYNENSIYKMLSDLKLFYFNLQTYSYLVERYRSAVTRYKHLYYKHLMMPNLSIVYGVSPTLPFGLLNSREAQNYSNHILDSINQLNKFWSSENSPFSMKNLMENSK